MLFVRDVKSIWLDEPFHLLEMSIDTAAITQDTMSRDRSTSIQSLSVVDGLLLKGNVPKLRPQIRNGMQC